MRYETGEDVCTSKSLATLKKLFQNIVLQDLLLQLGMEWKGTVYSNFSFTETVFSIWLFWKFMMHLNSNGYAPPRPSSVAGDNAQTQ